MKHPPGRVTAMTLITDGNEDLQDIMTENLCELPRTSDFYPYIDANSSPLFGGYPAAHSSTRETKRRQRNRASFSSHQSVQLLTLPRVVLWCRDGVCYPYYKKPNKNGKPGPSTQATPRFSYTNPTFQTEEPEEEEEENMPTIITMKSPENLSPSSLNNNNKAPKESLTNINHGNNDFKIHKHTINIKNIPASSSSSINGSISGSTTTSSSKSDRHHHYQVSTISSTVPRPISYYPDRVTLTVNSATASSSSNNNSDNDNTEHPNRSLPTSNSNTSVNPDFRHNNNNNNNNNSHSNHQFGSRKSSEKNVSSKCALGPGSGGSSFEDQNHSSRSNHCNHPHPHQNQNGIGGNHKSPDAELDEVLTFPSQNLNSSKTSSHNNNHNNKMTTAQVFANSISKPNPFCPSCNGIVPLNHHIESTELPAKIEPGFWNSPTFHNTTTNLHREASFHSYGGFTLNGQAGHISAKKHKMRRFCSSHKVAFVVSTFSLIVTIGLVITLLLMKKKGMMEAM